MAKQVVDYRVIATVTREVVYVVPARSPEEAEVVVEAFIEEGAEPAEDTILDFRVEEAFPVEEESMGELVPAQDWSDE